MTSGERARAAHRGFTLTELAVVFAVISLLLAAAMYTLSAQTEQRDLEETRRRLEAARELLFAFAIVNGRLPCPASTTTGATAGFEAPAGGGPCSTYFGGWLPARTIGFQVTDAAGNAVDAWGNPIRYAVSSTTPTCTPAATAASHFTVAASMRTNGISCQPNDLVVCSRSPVTITNIVCDANTSVTNQNIVAAIVFSTGKNGATGGTGTNEARNLDNNALFVTRPPDPATASGGEFDDQMTWITAGELYGKLIGAGLLP